MLQSALKHLTSHIGNIDFIAHTYAYM
jgi:hypothetical protein